LEQETEMALRLTALDHLVLTISNKAAILGPIIRNGAASKFHSISINDPDGNLSEIANQIDKV
jgi:hypothetical protein